MAKKLFTNNASAKLAAPVADSDTSFDVQAGQGAEFPTITGGNSFLGTLVGTAGIEIVEVTARTSDSMTVTRAQEGTSALAFSAGETFELRITAAELQSWEDFRVSLDTDATLGANSASKIPAQSAVKSYVDNKVAGLSWKQSVRAATTAPGTLSTSFENGDTIDGVTLATGDRILIKNQSTGAENGIYVVAVSGAPARASDADTATEIRQAAMYVEEGTANADTQFVCTTNAPITLGSTALTFAQLSTGGTPSGSAGGDLAGTYPNPTIASSVALGGSPTTTTQSPGDNTTKVATTAYVDAAVAGGAAALDDLTDVDTTGFADGKALVYDSGGGLWVPQTITGSGGIVPAWALDDLRTPPASPDAADDEFGGTDYPSETALDTGGTRFGSATAWATQNPGTSTITVGGGRLVIVPQIDSQHHGVEQAVPVGNWRYRALLTMRADNWSGVTETSLYIRNSANSHVLLSGPSMIAGALGLYVDAWSSMTAFSSSLRAGTPIDPVTWSGWVEVEYDGTNIIYRASPSGVEGSFTKYSTTAVATWPGAVTHIGIAALSNTATVAVVCDSFRRVA